MNLISKGYTHAFRFHATLRFIDKLCIINDDGDISSSYKYIFPKQLEQKLEHQGEHATFLYLGITIEDNKFVHKLFDKRDKFSLFIVGYYVCLLCLLWLYFVYYGLSIKQNSIINILWFNIFRVPMNSLMNTGADRLHGEAIYIIS